MAVHIVTVADMKLSAVEGDVLVTHALGSCLGITIHDPVVHVGGLLHVMLPLSTIDPKKGEKNPYMFVDTGVPKLFHECYKAGARKERLHVKVAGGACTRSEEEDDFFQIGKRNFIMLKKLFWKNGVVLRAHDVGGRESRTLSLDIESGEVAVKISGKSTTL